MNKFLILSLSASSLIFSISCLLIVIIITQEFAGKWEKCGEAKALKFISDMHYENMLEDAWHLYYQENNNQNSFREIKMQSRDEIEEVKKKAIHDGYKWNEIEEISSSAARKARVAFQENKK